MLQKLQKTGRRIDMALLPSKYIELDMNWTHRSEPAQNIPKITEVQFYSDNVIGKDNSRITIFQEPWTAL